MADPIVNAVLEDPVVKAVLESGSTGTGTGVTSTGKKAPTTVTSSTGQLVASPTSTEEEDRLSASQRAINLVWETTQMKIALSVIWGALLVSCVLSIFGKYLGTPDIQLAAVVFLFGVANLVTGFYFGRTNHQRTGGLQGNNVQSGR